MQTKTLQVLKPLFVGLSLFAVLARADAQQSPPLQNKGVAAKPIAAIKNLGAEIDGMQGRAFGMHMVTIEPGGATALHDHKDRPELLYVSQGTITEHKDGTSKEYGPGQAITATKETTHWLENKGLSPAAFIGAIIVRQP